MTDQKKSKAMHIILWIAQGLLAVMFIMAGLMKASQPIEALAESLPWVTTTPQALVRFIGISELLGGLGLLIPSIFRFKPYLTVWAALGLAAVMILAAIFHASRGEFSAIGMNIIIMGIALFIAWGRSKKVLILPKAHQQ
ncbi:DoxX family protein [Maribacter sp. MAR_2009_72]|uniref:DoxX family protein n=1 Tax=Maribacter sp. MAR_2009_72 TaxID=1250050 RepID=UPI00119C0591|nr:DoxX family protein [Maribacter sp. MAR_2009_72]TVZ16520.1 putative membrane protein YphA (DoxX/SURF4 family) [Maribacter sp. MAR_2009_72]